MDSGEAQCTHHHDMQTSERDAPYLPQQQNSFIRPFPNEDPVRSPKALSIDGAGSWRFLTSAVVSQPVHTVCVCVAGYEGRTLHTGVGTTILASISVTSIVQARVGRSVVYVVANVEANVEVGDKAELRLDARHARICIPNRLQSAGARFPPHPLMASTFAARKCCSVKIPVIVLSKSRACSVFEAATYAEYVNEVIHSFIWCIGKVYISRQPFNQPY
ncbi:hypothetical protein FKP32DRAFT_1599710 [Trametes sanguinea]|nr:hypothetical protein FKP32DRAFT_1599710 [Trametes sanguinea]